MFAGFWGQAVVKNGHEVLCLVHRKEILDQFVNTMSMAGLADDVGVISPAYVPTPWAPMQIASIWSLLKRQLTLRPKLIIVDEAHHVRASTWDKVLKAHPNAKIIGMTATPRRLDGLGLGEHFEAMHCGPTIRELVEWGYLAPMRTLSVPIGFHTVKKTETNEFNQRALAEQVNEKIVAKSAAAYMKHGLGKSGLFFGTNVKHSEMVAEELRSYGVRAAHVDAKTGKYQRERTFQAFRDKQLDVVCNVDLVSEGFDMPDCELVMDGQLTMSLSRYKQKAGRGMRPYPDDPRREKLFLDLVGNFVLHGTPEVEHAWSLDDEVDPEEQQKNTTKYPKGRQLRTCKACMTVFPPSQRYCPACGEEYPVGVEIKEEDVPLADVSGWAPAEKAKGKKKAKRSRAQINEALNQSHRHMAGGRPGEAWLALAEFAAEAGYVPQWAHRMADIVKIPIRDRGDVGL